MPTLDDLINRGVMGNLATPFSQSYRLCSGTQSQLVSGDRRFGLLLPARFLRFCLMRTQRNYDSKISSISAGRWTAYAAAAAATGFAAHTAEATIHYSGRDQPKDSWQERH